MSNATDEQSSGGDANQNARYRVMRINQCTGYHFDIQWQQKPSKSKGKIADRS